MAEPALLIVYFSHAGQNYVNGKIVELPAGNTEVAAKTLAEITDARLVRIEQAESYPEDYHELTEIAKKELRAGARPALKSAIPDVTGMDTLFLGYPNWWGTMPMPVWTFLDALDTAGKAIAPFCTNEGSGMGRSEKDIRALCRRRLCCPASPSPATRCMRRRRFCATGQRISWRDTGRESAANAALSVASANTLKHRRTAMNNFVFQNHTRIYFGKGVVGQYLAQLLEPYGKNVLLAYGGGSIKKTGIYDAVTAAVRAAGKAVFDFPGIMANPTKNKVDEGIRLVKEKNIDFILAVGGGSAIDCAKAIAIGSRYPGDWWTDFWLNQGRITFKQLPLGVVLTISGTGSEFDGGGVITNTETNIKTGRIYPELSPNFSLLDPDYTLTVPERQVRATAFDTMSHLMEFYFCRPDTDNVSDDLLEALLRAQIRNFRSSMKDLKDYDARSNIEWISSLALCGIMGLGKQPDFDCHNLEHQIGAFTDCVHGEGLAVITPPYYRWLMPHAVDRFVRFAVNVWGLAPQGDDKALAAAGVEALAGFIRSVGLPTTMQQLGVKDMAELTKIAQSVQTGPGTYCKCTPADVEAIFKACWE